MDVAAVNAVFGPPCRCGDCGRHTGNAKRETHQQRVRQPADSSPIRGCWIFLCPFSGEHHGKANHQARSLRRSGAAPVTAAAATAERDRGEGSAAVAPLSLHGACEMISNEQLRATFVTPAMAYYFERKLAPLPKADVDARVE